MRVSINGGTRSSSILIGFSHINHPAIGVPPFMETIIWGIYWSIASFRAGLNLPCSDLCGWAGMTWIDGSEASHLDFYVSPGQASSWIVSQMKFYMYSVFLHVYVCMYVTYVCMYVCIYIYTYVYCICILYMFDLYAYNRTYIMHYNTM